MIYAKMTMGECNAFIKKTERQLEHLKKTAHQYFEHDLQALIECYHQQIKRLQERKQILENHPNN